MLLWLTKIFLKKLLLPCFSNKSTARQSMNVKTIMGLCLLVTFNLRLGPSMGLLLLRIIDRNW